jgi:hypothetical protein
MPTTALTPLMLLLPQPNGSSSVPSIWLRDLMACPVVVDLRNIYRPEGMARYGFAYACVGRALAARENSDHDSLDRLLSLAKVTAHAPSF